MASKLSVFERRVKKLRNEDSKMRMIRGRKRAIERWGNLRKFVMYTYGIDNLEEKGNHVSNKLASEPVSFHIRKPYPREDSIDLDILVDSPTETVYLPKATHSSKIHSNLVNGNSSLDRITTAAANEEEKVQTIQSVGDDNLCSQRFTPNCGFPPIPPFLVIPVAQNCAFKIFHV